MKLSIKRTIGGALAASLAVAALAGCAPSSDGGGDGGDGGSSDVTLTLVTWGGTTEEGFKKVYADPFTAETGIKTKMVNPVDYGKYTAQLETGNITWDWVDIEGWFAYQRQADWATIDRDVVQYDDADVINPPGKDYSTIDWGIPSPSYSFVISYRTEEAQHPTTWEEFFDTDAIPGKRAIYNWPYGMLEVALLGDGVPMDELYPLDVDRALAKLDSVRDDLVFWNSGAELQQILSTGGAPFAFAWNNRVAALMKEDQPVAIEWGENLQDGSVNTIAAASPRLDETMQFFNFMMDADRQRDVALSTGYSPVLKSSFEKIDTDLQPLYNAYPANLEQAVGTIDHDWWAENYDAVSAKWTEWAAG
ncbi:extracellular solute-binding protein [Leucobacter soli]|uniref:Spermidine/putrescine transport system substrate-binding protein n=1 Tax=Leucobacter soli TaxID=2812850 RepID=A0A916JW86_9MICO|nr:extracellular solute-binding protein [Leucobacter soli]CAG7606304.1 hypothetical protein LEUCIP111803_00911 [Leucobacter soli]